MEILDYAAWKSELLGAIDTLPNTTEQGDRFVQLVLRDYFQLSEDDAVNATSPAGAGDRGVDAVHIIEGDGPDTPPEAVVMQGKYGAIGQTFSPYDEFSKFAGALRDAQAGKNTTDHIQRCANVLASEGSDGSSGSLRYLFATVDPMPATLQEHLENVRALARQLFGDKVLVDAISLRDVYEQIAGQGRDDAGLDLVCSGVSPTEGVFVGVASLVEVYMMLQAYATKHHGVLDSIYDRNVRKWLGRKVNRVNMGIQHTLEDTPQKFVAYNNGITIVCSGFEATSKGLRIDAPQIVNGCQTTRTLYDVMEIQLAGLTNQLRTNPKSQPYREAYLPFKLIAVPNLDDEFVKDITRFSNRQNAVRGRDFLALEDRFRELKGEAAKRGYFLEVQAGEYSVLPKAQRVKYPRERQVNAFQSILFYASGVLGKPHTAFGRSGDFTPGGREFDTLIDDLALDDLLVPWLVAQDADALGYSVGKKWHEAGDDHRSQTRYFFLYIFFLIATQVLQAVPSVDKTDRNVLYDKLMRLRGSSAVDKASGAIYRQLLDLADGSVKTYMRLAQKHGWYTDRNAFLKNEGLLLDERLEPALQAALLYESDIRKEADKLLAYADARIS